MQPLVIIEACDIDWQINVDHMFTAYLAGLQETEDQDHGYNIHGFIR